MVVQKDKYSNNWNFIDPQAGKNHECEPVLSQFEMVKLFRTNQV